MARSRPTSATSCTSGATWVPSTGSGTIAVIDSTTEKVIGTVPEGTAEDVDRAVTAAGDAFPEWSPTPVGSGPRS